MVLLALVTRFDAREKETVAEQYKAKWYPDSELPGNL
jgi:hypothetical protein